MSNTLGGGPSVKGGAFPDTWPAAILLPTEAAGQETGREATLVYMPPLPTLYIHPYTTLGTPWVYTTLPQCHPGSL